MVAVAVGWLVARVIGVVLTRVIVAGIAGSSGGNPLLQLLDLEAGLLQFVAGFVTGFHEDPPLGVTGLAMAMLTTKRRQGVRQEPSPWDTPPALAVRVAR